MLRKTCLAAVVLAIFVIFSALSGPAAVTTKNLCSISHPSDRQIAWKCYQLKKEDLPEVIFGSHWQDVLRFNRVDRRHLRPGISLKVPIKLEDLSNWHPLSQLWFPASGYPKYVLIDLEEQFLGAYELGWLKFSMPIASGQKGSTTPKGFFKVLGRDKNHISSKYVIEGTEVPYPMRWAVKFLVSKSGVAFWIHGRDLPGYPVSHGCVGLYDEEMQKKFYRDASQQPVLTDSKKFFLWLFPDGENDRGYVAFPSKALAIPVEIK